MNRVVCVIASLLLTTPHAEAQTVVATGVAEEATEANSQTKIGVDRGGTVHLTFVKPSGGVDQVFVASSSDGRRWQVQQVTRAPVPARYPALAVEPRGAVHLAWTQYDNGVGKVYYARRDGRAWSRTGKVSPGEAYAGVPSLVVDAADTVHLVWYGIRAQAPSVRTRHGSIYEIFYTALSGGRWSRPVMISPGIPDSVNASLALDDLGRLHSAWYQFDLRAYQARHVLRPAPNGAGMRDRAWGQPVTVSSGRADALGVTLATGPGGAAYVLWERREPPGGRIYAAEHRGGWSGQQQVSPGSQNAFHPTAAVDGQGNLFAAWDSDGQIYLRRREGTWQNAGRITTNGRNTLPAIAAGANAVVLMWTAQTEGDTRVEFTTVAGRLEPPSPLPWNMRRIVLVLAVVGIYLLFAWSQWRRSRKA